MKSIATNFVLCLSYFHSKARNSSAQVTAVLLIDALRIASWSSILFVPPLYIIHLHAVHHIEQEVMNWEQIFPWSAKFALELGQLRWKLGDAVDGGTCNDWVGDIKVLYSLSPLFSLFSFQSLYFIDWNCYPLPERRVSIPFQVVKGLSPIWYKIWRK